MRPPLDRPEQPALEKDVPPEDGDEGRHEHEPGHREVRQAEQGGRAPDGDVPVPRDRIGQQPVAVLQDHGEEQEVLDEAPEEVRDRVDDGRRADQTLHRDDGHERDREQQAGVVQAAGQVFGVPPAPDEPPPLRGPRAARGTGDPASALCL